MERRTVLAGIAGLAAGACAASQSRALEPRTSSAPTSTGPVCGPLVRAGVAVTGTGPDVLLLPGLASSAAVFDDTVARLSGRLTCHLVQVSGFAGAASSWPAGDGTKLAALAGEIAGYLTCLGRPVSMIGHSMGGLVGLMIARDHPGLLARLMVVDALPFFSVLIDPASTAQSIAPMAAAASGFMQAQPEAAFRAAQERSIANLVKHSAWRARVLDWSLTSDRAVMAGLMAEVMTTDVRPDLAKITTPVTVAYAFDPMMPLPADRVEALYRSQYAGLADVRLERVEGALHFIMADQPERFAELVDQFLAG